MAASLSRGFPRFLSVTTDAFAHGVTAGDKNYIQETQGTRILPFIHLGAKHMVTGD